MSVLYGMVQPFLAEETRTKIHVLGSKDHECSIQSNCLWMNGLGIQLNGLEEDR